MPPSPHDSFDLAVIVAAVILATFTCGLALRLGYIVGDLL